MKKCPTCGCDEHEAGKCANCNCGESEVITGYQPRELHSLHRLTSNFQGDRYDGVVGYIVPAVHYD